MAASGVERVLTLGGASIGGASIGGASIGGASIGGGASTNTWWCVSENSTTFFVCSAAPQTAGVVPVVLAWVSCAVVRTS